MDNQPKNTPNLPAVDDLSQKTTEPQSSPQLGSTSVTPMQTIISPTQPPTPQEDATISQIVTPHIIPTPTPQQPATTESPNQPTQEVTPHISNATGLPVQAEQFEPKPKRRRKGLFVALIVVGVFLISSTAAGYFGYVVPNKPENVWKSAMKNMGTAYDSLTKIDLDLSTTKGTETTGEFSYDGDSIFNGDFSVKSYNTDLVMQLNLTQETLKTKIELMLVTPESKKVPNLYFKIAELSGTNDITDALLQDDFSKIVGKWYILDTSSYDEDLIKEDAPNEYTKEDYTELYNKVGESVKEYLFSTDKDKAVLNVNEFVTKEDSFGHSAYKYKVKVNNSALNSFEKSVISNVQNTKIGSTLVKDNELDNYVGTLDDTLPSDEEFDVWIDKKTKLIQNIRYYNKNDQNTYSEFGQLYQGGDVIPLFFNTQQSTESGNDDFNIKLDLDQKQKTANLKAAYTQADGTGAFTISSNLRTNTNELQLTEPTDARPILELLYGEGYEDDTTSPTPIPAINTNTLGWNIGLENVNQTNITNYIKNFDSLAKILQQISRSQIQKP